MTDEELAGRLAEYVDANGFPPSVREVGEMLGLSSLSSAHYVLHRMEKKGLIERVPGIKRGLRIHAAKMVADTEKM